MPVTYACEPLTADNVVAMDAITKNYYAYTLERGTNVGIPPYAFKWDTYRKCEDAGILTSTNARINGRIVGFTLYVVMPALHHDGQIVADCDTIMVDPSVQGEGIGKGLLQFTETVLYNIGADIIVNRYRTRVGVRPMFEGQGFTLWETAYMKKVK